MVTFFSFSPEEDLSRGSLFYKRQVTMLGIFEAMIRIYFYNLLMRQSNSISCYVKLMVEDLEVFLSFSLLFEFLISNSFIVLSLTILLFFGTVFS